MRKGRDGGEKKQENRGKKEKRLMKIKATTSLQAVDRPNDDRWTAARSCQNSKALLKNALTPYNSSHQSAVWVRGGGKLNISSISP